MAINDKLQKARELLEDVGAEIETELPSELNWVNQDFEEIFEILNSIQEIDLDKEIKK